MDAIAAPHPAGETKTYGEIAQELGDKTLARAAGQALGANPFAPVVPCNRVLGAKGWQGGFSAPGGPMLKMRMLGIGGRAAGWAGGIRLVLKVFKRFAANVCCLRRRISANAVWHLRGLFLGFARVLKQES